MTSRAHRSLSPAREQWEPRGTWTDEFCGPFGVRPARPSRARRTNLAYVGEFDARGRQSTVRLWTLE
jgi:hypothetical protein